MAMTGKPWTHAELKLLVALMKEKTPIEMSTTKLESPEEEVRAKVDKLSILKKQ